MKKEYSDIKDIIFECIKSIVISSVVCFILYFFLAFILAAIWEDNPNKNLYASCCILILYFIAFYAIHEQHRSEPFCPIEEKYTIKKEIKIYFDKEGKYLLIIYGICSVIMEITCLITPADEPNIIGTIFVMFFPLTPYIPIPIFRSIISFALCAVGSVFLVLLRTHKLQKLLRE